MGKRKQHASPSSSLPDSPRTGPSRGDPLDEFTLAAYAEGRAWIVSTAASQSQAPLPGVRVSTRTRPLRRDPLPLTLHRPSIEAFWQARLGVPTFSQQQLQEILEVTEFSYSDLLQPFVLFAPLYAELENKARQRMIVRTWYKEAFASFVRAGLGPTSTLGPLATRSIAWICAFSAGVIDEDSCCKPSVLRLYPVWAVSQPNRPRWWGC